MKNTIYSLVVAGALLVFGACTPSETQEESSTEAAVTADNTPLGQASVVDSESDPNILQVAIGSEAHSTLVAAVQAAHIEHVLVNAGPLTVFAPTNEAFAKLPEGTVETLLKPENVGDLTTILTRHAAPGSYNIEALKKEVRKGRTKLYMATGDYFEISQEGDDVFVNGVKVEASVQTANGIVNVVNTVLLPKSE